MIKKLIPIVKKIWGWIKKNKKKIYTVIKEIIEWIWVFLCN